MQPLKNIIINRPTTLVDKYLTRDFQELGLKIAQMLGDMPHKSLYIKLAKTHDRKTLEEVMSFASDSNARNKGALFMWKLKEIKTKVSEKDQDK